MRDIRELVRSENANSGLAFREHVYDRQEDEALARDLLALANADVNGARLLVLGVHDVVGGERTLLGVERQDVVALKKRVATLVADSIEPALTITLGATEIDGKLVGIVCIGEGTDPPYLLKAPVGNGLPVGTGFVRRGTRTLPLRRADLQALFTRRDDEAGSATVVRIGFPGKRLLDEITLTVLPVEQLPSQLAARRLRAMLDAKEASREAFGQTETHVSRLMHARVYGAETPFEAHTDESLWRRLEHAADDYHDADNFYQYEVCAHKLQLAARNDGGDDLHDVCVELRVQQLEGLGIAERLFREDGDNAQTGSYPRVSAQQNTFRLESRLGTLEHGQTVNLFQEPPRLWIREPAAGKTVVLDYVVEARELEKPLRDTLLIHIGT